jgi:hypothetical protein
MLPVDSMTTSCKTDDGHADVAMYEWISNIIHQQDLFKFLALTAAILCTL